MDNTPFIIRENTEEATEMKKAQPHHGKDQDHEFLKRRDEIGSSFIYGMSNKFGPVYQIRYNRRTRQGVGE